MKILSIPQGIYLAQEKKMSKKSFHHGLFPTSQTEFSLGLTFDTAIMKTFFI